MLLTFLLTPPVLDDFVPLEAGSGLMVVGILGFCVCALILAAGMYLVPGGKMDEWESLTGASSVMGVGLLTRR